ncbi:MAG: hypothetical protein AAFN77_07865 [Planctomycetota bacterium]
MSQPSSDDEMFSDPMADQSLDQQEAEVQQQYRKPEFNVYSMMLLLSFLFVTTSAVILYMNIK